MRDHDSLGLNDQLAVFICDAVAAHQHAVGIDAVGCAGDERAVILTGNGDKLGDVAGQNNANLVNLIGDHLVEDGDREAVPFRDLVQIGKEPGTGQTAVAGEHSMGAGAADGKTRPIHMADGDLQYRFLGGMVNGNVDIDGGDIDIAHQPGAGEVEQQIILGQVLLGHGVGVLLLQQARVIVVGGLDHGGQLSGVRLVHLTGVRDDGAGGVEGVPPVADRGISHDRDAEQHDENQQPGGQIRFFLLFRGFLFVHGTVLGGEGLGVRIVTQGYGLSLKGLGAAMDGLRPFHAPSPRALRALAMTCEGVRQYVHIAALGRG